jgi:HD-GYP domain-containing protein (c-di-GMP phosphodiesterase class II)
MGGDEFCLLAPLESGGERIVAEAAAALHERGEGFDIGCSFGAVLVPDEAATVPEALRIADVRMYAHKGAGRPSAARQATDALLQALAERDPDLGEHVDGVAELAQAVGARLALAPELLPVHAEAARLHDIGKMAIPDSILAKAGPLDEEEWQFMRRHTVIGERILTAAPALAPVAGLVRSSHERYDGGGYPDGLAGADIPLAARIIAVCDAFDAMCADRPYRRARPVAEAIAELRAGAGTQFDPEVVQVFAAVVAERQQLVAEPRA